MIERIEPDVTYQKYRQSDKVLLEDFARLEGNTGLYVTSEPETAVLRQENILPLVRHKIQHSYPPGVDVITDSMQAGFQKIITVSEEQNGQALYPVEHVLHVLYETSLGDARAQGFYQFPVMGMPEGEQVYALGEVLGRHGEKLLFSRRQVHVIQNLAKNPPRPTIVRTRK